MKCVYILLSEFIVFYPVFQGQKRRQVIFYTVAEFLLSTDLEWQHLLVVVQWANLVVEFRKEFVHNFLSNSN